MFIVLGAIACRYNCDITIIQSTPDATTAFVLLSGSVFAAQNVSDSHHERTSQWRNNNVRGAVQPPPVSRVTLKSKISLSLSAIVL